MEMSKRVDQMTKGPLRQFRCNNEKCWLKVGVTTLTLMSSLTLSMMVANAQTATANVAQTTQTSEKDTPGTVTTQIQSSKSVDSASVPSMNATSKNSEDSSHSDVSDPNKRASSTTENTAEDNGGAVSRNAVTTDSDNVSSDSKTTQSTQTDTTNKIKDDAYLKSLGIDADHLNSTNVLKIASLFHIFAKQASLNADTNGNLAVGTLKNSNDFGTRGTSDNLTTGDIYYIQNLGSNVISNAFRNTTANHVVLGKGIQVGTQNNKVTINGVQITNLKPGDVSQDTNGETYINFDQVFAALLKESTDFSSQVDSDGVKKDFSDQNQRYVDVTNATSSDGIVYVNVPISNLSAPQAFTIKGLDKNSPTIVINVTDIPAEGVQNISTQVQLVYSSDHTKQETLSNGESHNEPNHVLWNLGTGNQTFNFNSGRFMGSILAPNATINAGVNIDGNIVASTVNITGGESHRWDIQSQVPPTDNTHVEYGLPDGIQVKIQVPTTNVPHTYVQGAVPDGIQVKTQVPTTNVPHTYVQGEVPDGVRVYTKAAVGPALAVAYATVPNDPTQPSQPTTPARPTTPSTPQPAQPVQPTTPAQPEPNQTVTTGVDGDHAPEMIKAHDQPQTESLIAEDSEAEPQTTTELQATTGLGRKASVDGQFVFGRTGIGQSKPSEIQNAMPQLNEGSEKPVSILGYALLAIGGLTRWLTFKGKRQN
ncbi:collagen-binding domain-containing protein [Secundilactobacillus mixtipabuli]|uniref:Cell surface protein n=1 Tax=Secundilactobacillus mixtipabuli TaxID=1435342 RepID=A0A1Z5IAP0_9LACO|nr:collagen-binding domain-containing protein [Secundilactobacillus mixtipabuli]GAW98794.1 cell surface protein [Secundilactobacillus mixtipabuli]